MRAIRLFAVALAIFVLPAHAQTTSPRATTPREQLDLLTATLSKWPNDFVLRERIMKLAQDVNPLPPLPAEARTAFLQAEAIGKLAKTPSDWVGAVDALRRGTTLAPWFATGYFNLGVAEQGAEHFAAADRSFGIYLLSRPPASRAQSSRDYLAQIEVSEELLAKQVAAGSRTSEVLLGALDGATYDCGSDGKYFYRIEIRNGELLDNMVEKQPPPAIPPQPNPFGLQAAGPAPRPAADRRQGLTFYKPNGGIHTVSPSQVDRRSQAPCRRIRGNR